MAKTKTVSPQSVYSDFLLLALDEKQEHYNTVKKHLEDAAKSLEDEVNHRKESLEKLNQTLQKTA